VAVIAIADPRWQERPLAIAVVMTEEDKPQVIDQLRRFLSDKVARFWIPEYWCFVSEIPKTSVGKMDKKVLRQMLAEGQLKITQYESQGEGNG